jgi:hypothetical protein
MFHYFLRELPQKDTEGTQATILLFKDRVAAEREFKAIDSPSILDPFKQNGADIRFDTAIFLGYPKTVSG